MPTERVVEVVCELCQGSGKVGGECYVCLGLGWHRRYAHPSSLAAAMLTLAEAVDRLNYENDVFGAYPGSPAYNAYEAALAAVRSHKDYRRPE